MIPSCLFTDPQVAHIGLTESEAGRQRIAVRVLKLPMTAVLRTRTIDETRGFMKALIETDGDRILGFTMIGSEAGEVMVVVQMAMLAGLPYTALRDAVLTHPTMAEGLNSLFSQRQSAGRSYAAHNNSSSHKEAADEYGIETKGVPPVPLLEAFRTNTSTKTESTAAFTPPK